MWFRILFGLELAASAVKPIEEKEDPPVKVGDVKVIDGIEYIAFQEVDKQCTSCVAKGGDDPTPLCTSLPECEGIIFKKMTPSIKVAMASTYGVFGDTQKPKEPHFIGASGVAVATGTTGVSTQENIMPAVNATTFDIIKSQLHELQIGAYLQRRSLVQGLTKGQKTTIDNYRNWFSQAGYLATADGAGSYKKLKHIDPTMTSNRLRKEAYPQLRNNG